MPSKKSLNKTREDILVELGEKVVTAYKDLQNVQDDIICDFIDSDINKGSPDPKTIYPQPQSFLVNIIG